jgi:RHS repeat-associated protein
LTKRWIYRDKLKPVAELDGSGNIVSHFVYGTRKNIPDFILRNNKTYRVISDHLGSPRLVVNVADSNEKPFRADYSAFGEVTGTGLDWMPFGFAGGLYDPDTKLVRFGARDYDPMIGRWTAKDPIRFRGKQANLYVYVDNDPINSRDPTGREGILEYVFEKGLGIAWGDEAAEAFSAASLCYKNPTLCRSAAACGAAAFAGASMFVGEPGDVSEMDWIYSDGSCWDDTGGRSEPLPDEMNACPRTSELESTAPPNSESECGVTQTCN